VAERRQSSLNTRLYGRRIGLHLALASLVFLGGATEAAAQKLDIRSKSKLVIGKMQLTDTATFSDKRYSIGYTNTFREGRSMSNAFAGRIDPTKSSKVYVNTALQGGNTDWEAKLNQKYRAFTFDVGAGSNGLLHTGVQYGKRKGKGFGFSASWVGDDRRSGANLQLWHYIETIDIVATVRHDRRGFGWSVNTGDKLANILRGVLRYETSGGADGSGSASQVIFGRSMRDGSDTFSGFDRISYIPPEDVFGEDGINIRSPLYDDDDPFAWLIEGYGARFGEVDLGKKRLIEAEFVNYFTDTIFAGGDFTMEDGVTQSIETQFGITGESLKFSANFGYAFEAERFSGAVQFRWTPIK